MKLHRLVKGDQPVGYMHWCPGCKGPHAIYVEQPQPSTGAKWTFDGNLEQPTFGPSILCFTTKGKWEGEKWVPDGPRVTICHYFIKAGMIQFCGDSPHALKGQTVPLPEYPERYLEAPAQPAPNPRRRRRPRARSDRSASRSGK